MTANVWSEFWMLVPTSWLSTVVVLAAGSFGLTQIHGSGCHKACEWLRNSLTECKSLKVLVQRDLRTEFNLRFPPASTGKSHRPQLLHNGRRFLCCGEEQSNGEWVQRNVRVPDSAG